MDRSRGSGTGEEPLSPYHHLLRECNGNLQRIQQILLELQEFALLQCGRLELTLHQGDLVELAHDVLGERPMIPSSALLVIHAEQEPLLARYDQRRMRFVLSTLLNYVLARAQREKVIRVRLREDGTQQAALVSVQYEAAETEEQQHLFELQYWSRQEPDSHHLEMGLSLYLSAAIIALHGGRIWSERHRTTHRIGFVLPRKPPEER